MPLENPPKKCARVRSVFLSSQRKGWYLVYGTTLRVPVHARLREPVSWTIQPGAWGNPSLAHAAERCQIFLGRYASERCSMAMTVTVRRSPSMR